MKRFLMFNLFTFIFILNFLKGSTPLSERVRHAILNRSELKPNKITSASTIDVNIVIDKVPFDIQNEIWSFLDFKSLLNLKNTCKYLQNGLNEYFKLTINIKIGPQCIHKDSLINGLLHFILKENIPSKDDHNDIYDFLALMIIKFKSDDYSSKEIPRIVYHHILQYLFEIIFETDESVPIYEETWGNWLVFQLQKHSLPRTLKYFIKLKEEDYYKRPNWNFIQWKELLEFVATKPNPLAQKSFLIENYLYSHVNVVKMPQEFACFFFNSLHLELVSSNNVPLIFLKLLNYNFVSRSLLKRLTVDDYYFLKKKIKNYNQNRDFNFKQFILENYEQPFGQVWDYIWSRDDRKNPFNPDHLIHFDSSAILNDIIATQSPNLVHIEIFSYLIRSIEIQTIKSYENNLVQLLSKHRNNLYWDILLNEYELPINLFYYSGNGRKFHVYSNELVTAFCTYEQNIKIFVDSLSKDHPLPLLFVHVTVLAQAKHLIINKFNLEQRYLFDGLFEDFEFTNLNEEIKEHLRGQVMRFIDILSLINNERLNDVFGVSDNLFNDEMNVNTNSPIYSVRNFLNFAVLEEI